MKLADSRTMGSLLAAFAGESQVRNKYEFYADRARRDGNEVLADVFQKTADNERAHAKVWLKLIKGGEIPDSSTNLLDAAKGEHFEHSEMYKNFADIAKSEGFLDIAATFAAVGEIELAHAQRYDSFIKKTENGTLFTRPIEIDWICLNCGSVHRGTEPPVRCFVCAHPSGYFAEKKAE